MNVLLIDDDAVASNFVAMQLRMLGKTPHLASGGKAGLELLAQQSIALVLLDCQMPEMDGFETASAIRQTGFQGPIIGLTAENTPDTRDRCLRAGMTEYECKPIDVGRLKRVLDQHLSAPASEPAATRDPLAKARGLAEKSGFAGLAKRMADGFIKSTEATLERNDVSTLAALRDSAVQFGAEDFADEVVRALETSDLGPLRAGWERCKEALLKA